MREITESPSQEVIQRAFELIREPNVVDVCLGVNLGKFTRLIWITDIEAVTKDERLRTSHLLLSLHLCQGELHVSH